MAEPEQDGVFSLRMRFTRGDLNTHRPPHIPARILWPALTFPAVIDPANATAPDDASTCVTLVIITPQPTLTRKQASDHLRFVPWEQRHMRYLGPGPAHSFTPDEIEVRVNLEKLGRMSQADRFVRHIYFGYDATVANGFSAALSVFVLNFYQKLGYQYLHEIRISRQASARLAAGQYNLFWVNTDWNDKPEKISDEMQLLMEKYATPLREAFVESLEDDPPGTLEQRLQYLLNEYEYDYDATHEPYNHGTVSLDASKRTEVLHPLIIRSSADELKIAHLTDLHYSVRADVYQENLRRGVSFSDHPAQPTGQGDSTELPTFPVDYSNWNTNASKLYAEARQNCDVLLLTGDLIDYGRGYWGLPYTAEQGNDLLYQEDRNWFLFYYAMASGSSYQKPVYTILGNHDWRINPYPPLATGAPDPRAMINNDLSFDKRHLVEIIQQAHGPGFKKAYSVAYESTGVRDMLDEAPGVAVVSFAKLITHSDNLKADHLPIVTTVDSIAWYLLLMNPFLDYSFHLAGGYDVVMLDWAEEEHLMFKVVVNGKEQSYSLDDAQKGRASYPGPTAKLCLTNFQKDMVEGFLMRPGKAKIVGIHAPPIGPWTEWTDDHLRYGEAAFDSEYFAEQVFALAPKGAAPRHEAVYNSFDNNRDWFIRKMRQKSANVRLVLSGHIHRNGLLVAYEGATTDYPDSTGELHTKLVDLSTVPGAPVPAVSTAQWATDAPLYVNTTSAGPRGHLFAAKKKKPTDPDIYVDPGYSTIDLASDGTIRAFKFRPDKSAAAPAPATTATGASGT